MLNFPKQIVPTSFYNWTGLRVGRSFVTDSGRFLFVYTRRQCTASAVSFSIFPPRPLRVLFRLIFKNNFFETFPSTSPPSSILTLNISIFTVFPFDPVAGLINRFPPIAGFNYILFKKKYTEPAHDSRLPQCTGSIKSNSKPKKQTTLAMHVSSIQHDRPPYGLGAEAVSELYRHAILLYCLFV